jgi:regulator of sigma E protease
MSDNILVRILSEPWAIALVLLFFGASIFVHELGHYLAARWRGLVVERFSIGFGPRLFGWRDRQGVDWRVSLIPLGGYVALPQMGDLRGVETEGGDPDHRPPLATLSYADKMYVAVAGVICNVLFALALGSVLWITGIDVPEEAETTRVGLVFAQLTDAEGMEREGPAQRAGLLPGDVIRRIDDRPVKDWQDLTYALATGTRRSEHGNPRADFVVERNGQEMTLTVFPLLDAEEGIRRIGIAPASSLRVGATMDHSPAARAGLQSGDNIVAVNGTPVFHPAALSRAIQDTPDVPLVLAVEREAAMPAILHLELTPQPVVYNVAGDTVPMIGIRWQQILARRHVDPVSQVHDAFTTTLRVLGALFHPRSDVGINNLSGPVGISYALYVISQIGILDVLGIVVLININLAIINLLPIPVLDGGHMVLATIAKLRGRPLPAGIVNGVQSAFVLLFLGLFVYITFFDVGRVHRNESAAIEAENAARQRVPIVFPAPAADPAP